MGHLVKGMGRVVPAPILDALGEADRLVAGARADAERLRADATAVREQGYRQGLEAGRDAGYAELTEILAAARADAERLRIGVRESALTLAVGMAEKIVGRTVALDPRTLADIAEQALAASRARTGTVTLRVHPEDLATITAERPRLAERLTAGADLRLVADASVGRAGCVVETPMGRLDARLATQLAALERALAAKDKRG